MKSPIPQDPVFFTETLLGLIGTARGIVLENLSNSAENSDYWQRALSTLRQVTRQTYIRKISPTCAEALSVFISQPSTAHFDELADTCS